MEKKDKYDKTSTRRQLAHIERLASTNGRRLVLDLNEEHTKKLKDIIDANYGSTAVASVRRMIDEIHEKLGLGA
jgi:hypothetical protein